MPGYPQSNDLNTVLSGADVIAQVYTSCSLKHLQTLKYKIQKLDELELFCKEKWSLSDIN